MLSLLSTAKCGHGKKIPNLFNRRLQSIETMTPARTVSTRTSLKTHSLVGTISLFPPSFRVALRAWEHDTHSPPHFAISVLETYTGTRQHFIALQSLNGQQIDVTSMPDSVLSCSRRFNLPA